jgi:hypothetical protein
MNELINQPGILPCLIALSLIGLSTVLYWSVRFLLWLIAWAYSFLLVPVLTLITIIAYLGYFYRGQEGLLLGLCIPIGIASVISFIAYCINKFG